MRDSERTRRAQEYQRKKQSHLENRVAVKAALQPSRLNETCGCGSGRPFRACCFRPGHPSYSLARYIKQLKNIKERVCTRVTSTLLARYKNGDDAIAKAADDLSEEMGVARLIPLSLKAADGGKAALLSASIHFEALVLDRAELLGALQDWSLSPEPSWA